MSLKTTSNMVLNTHKRVKAQSRYIRNYCSISNFRIGVKYVFQFGWRYLDFIWEIIKKNVKSSKMIPHKNALFTMENNTSPDKLCIWSIPWVYLQCRGNHQSQNNKDRQSSATPLNPMFEQSPLHLLHNLHWHSNHHTIHDTNYIK